MLLLALRLQHLNLSYTLGLIYVHNSCSSTKFLSVLCSDPKLVVAIKSQLQQIAWAMYSSPPVHGVLLVATILSNPDIKSLWVKEVQVRTY